MLRLLSFTVFLATWWGAALLAGGEKLPPPAAVLAAIVAAVGVRETPAKSSAVEPLAAAAG